MGTSADKLNRLIQTKAEIKNAIIEKGVEVDSSTPFKDYANKIKEISGGGGSTEWQPDKEWFDIKTILQEDSREYAGKAIILYSDTDMFTRFSKSSSSSNLAAIATSDGSFYNSFPVTHYWDRSKDKLSSSGYKTRYLILYFSSSSIPYTDFNSYYIDNSLYAVFGCNITKVSTQTFGGTTFFYNNYTIQYFELLDGYNFDFGSNWASFCANCYSLRKLPDNLDTSSATSMSSFCTYCTSLEKLPDSLNTSNVTNFYSFCSYAKNLRKLPDSLDTSNGTYFTGFGQYCDNLMYIPSVIDLSKNNDSLGNFLYYCRSLKNIKIRLGTAYSLQLGSVGSGRINTESIKFIADNAPTVTSSRTVTLGGANITACGGASSDIIITLNNKGWTVT